MKVEMAYASEDIVGESLVWDDRRNCLFWVDIIGKKIHRLDPETGQRRSWETPDFVTSIGLRADGGAIVGLRKTICLWDFDDQFRPFAEVEPDLPANRLNEGVVGPDGAFWVGTMQNNIAPDGAPVDITESTGRLYRCGPDGTVTCPGADRFGITNTLVWPDAQTLITADTIRNEIYSYDLEAGGTALGARRVVVGDHGRGLPDGSTMDAEGMIWNCRVVGGASLLRFDRDGAQRTSVDLPCTWPTSCAYGGADLDRLYVTSARFTMPAEHLATHPQEGGLFALKPGVRGRAAHRFGG